MAEDVIDFPPTLKGQANLLKTQQTELDRALRAPAPSGEALALCSQQHAHLHPAEASGHTAWSFEDNLLSGLQERHLRMVPTGEEHSIAWLLWHMTRCEDITMNLLVVRGKQGLVTGGHLGRMKIAWRDTGNTMTPDDIVNFSEAVDLDALRAYRVAVARQTNALIHQMDSRELNRKVRAEDMRRVWDEGALLPGAESIGSYWGNRTIAGLLLMPATRHQLQHLMEALAIIRKLDK